ncbi:hypothetical protein ABZ023_34195 [Streptomyces sp. NPDC006367]|uniref:hypothetical protein n=1 Tax=unclassified Streptomyces TaxID=2593676 RepID=UPI0033B9876F
MTEGQTGPDEAITAMQSQLTANGLNVHPHGKGLRVDLSNATAIYLALTNSPYGPRWSARSGWTVVYDTTEQDIIPADIAADIDAAWAAEAVARYTAETERGTDLAGVFGGNLGQVLERAFAAHGIPTEDHPDNGLVVTALLAKLPDGNDVGIWDAVNETNSIPAADYGRFGAQYRRVKDLPDDVDVPESEIPLTYTGSLWGDLAVLIHTVKSLYGAAK